MTPDTEQLRNRKTSTCPIPVLCTDSWWFLITDGVFSSTGAVVSWDLTNLSGKWKRIVEGESYRICGKFNWKSPATKQKQHTQKFMQFHTTYNIGYRHTDHRLCKDVYEDVIGPSAIIHIWGLNSFRVRARSFSLSPRKPREVTGIGANAG